MDKRVESAQAFMEENLSRRLRLAELAQSVNLSPSHLRQLFKSETGLAPTQYLMELRMRQAKFLLENTFLRIKEIMHQVGVRDKSHFVKSFKRMYGTTPRQHRAQQSNSHAPAASRQQGN